MEANSNSIYFFKFKKTGTINDRSSKAIQNEIKNAILKQDDLELVNKIELATFLEQEKIATYSTGYNSGVWYDLSKINNYRSKKFFPSIYNFKGNRYNYSQISIYFFETFFKEKIDS